MRRQAAAATRRAVEQRGSCTLAHRCKAQLQGTADSVQPTTRNLQRTGNDKPTGSTIVHATSHKLQLTVDRDKHARVGLAVGRASRDEHLDPARVHLHSRHVLVLVHVHVHHLDPSIEESECTCDCPATLRIARYC